MKTLRVKDSRGIPVKGWTFGTFKATQVRIGFTNRMLIGWQINSPDGVERFNEGNWQQFVPFALRIVSNYGYTTDLS